MRKFKVLILPIIVLAMAIAIGFYINPKIAAFTDGDIDKRQIILLDAGHGGLTNTIKV